MKRILLVLAVTFAVTAGLDYTLASPHIVAQQASYSQLSTNDQQGNNDQNNDDGYYRHYRHYRHHDAPYCDGDDNYCPC